MTLSAPADTALKPKAPVRNTTDISDLMLFMFITSFPANSRLCYIRLTSSEKILSRVLKTAFHIVSSVSGHRKRTLECNSADGKNMEQVVRRRAFKCFTVFVVETIFPRAEHVLITCPSDIQVIFSVVRTKWLFHFPFKPKTA